MIAPFVCVVPDGTGGTDRTEEYLLRAFDRTYTGQLNPLRGSEQVEYAASVGRRSPSALAPKPARRRRRGSGRKAPTPRPAWRLPTLHKPLEVGAFVARRQANP